MNHLGLAAGLRRSGLSMNELWIRQVGVGGEAGPLELEAYVLGVLRSDDLQYNMIAQALNDHFVEEGGDHPVGYRTLRHPPTA